MRLHCHECGASWKIDPEVAHESKHCRQCGSPLHAPAASTPGATQPTWPRGAGLGRVEQSLPSAPVEATRKRQNWVIGVCIAVLIAAIAAFTYIWIL